MACLTLLEDWRFLPLASPAKKETPLQPHRLPTWILWTIAAAAVLGASACDKKTSNDTPAASTSAPSSSGASLTVETYCSAFCGKLCRTCGDRACSTTCNLRCHFGRPPSTVMDGHDPKVALARTQTDLDACLATITAQSCPSIMGGQVPPACFTIQH
jgi:hypothetical protein